MLRIFKFRKVSQTGFSFRKFKKVFTMDSFKLLVSAAFLWLQKTHLKKRHPAKSRLIPGYPRITRTVTNPGIPRYKSG